MQVSIGQLNEGTPVKASDSSPGNAQAVPSTVQTQPNMAPMVGNIHGNNVPVVAPVQFIQPIIFQQPLKDSPNMGYLKPQVRHPCG